MVSSLDNWDGSISKTVNKNPSRITDLLDSSTAGGASTLNKTADEKINAVGVRNGFQNMVTSLDVYGASNSNQLLSRDMLPSSLANDVSQFSPTRNSFSFIPISSSPLHIRMPPVIQEPPILSTLLNPLSSINLDALELISIHTADGYGEDDDEGEMEDVSDILAYPPSVTSPTHYEQNLSLTNNSPLFTPPPEEDNRSVDILSSSPKQSQAKIPAVLHQPRPRRLIMSHVQVPPLKRPWSDYRRLPTRNSTIVSKRRVAPSPYSSMQDALQASIQHNADLGVLPLDKLEKRKLTKKRREGGGAIAVAGPSVSHPSGARSKKRLERSFIDDDDDDNDDWAAPPRSKKRPRPVSKSVIEDLTITDDEFPSPRAASSSKNSPLVTQYSRPKAKTASNMMPDSISKPLPSPQPVTTSNFLHAAYNYETDTVTLCLDDIRPVPLEILTMNTRFLRQSLGNDISALGPGVYKSANINYTRQNGSRSCFLSIDANAPPIKDNIEEISVGGVIWELPAEREVIEILSDSSLKENLPHKKKKMDVPFFPTIQVSSRKNQHQKKPRDPHPKPKQRRQPTGDDVNRSSSGFKVPLDVPSFPPSLAIPSNANGITTTQHPKTQYPKKKGREPQHGQQQPPKRTSEEVIKGSSTTFDIPHSPPIHPNVASQHPMKPGTFELPRQPVHDSPVRPSHPARSSLDCQTFDSGFDFPNGAMPSAKALGKRRAISPMNISVITTPQFTVPTPHSSASIRDIQLSSDRPSISNLPHYVIRNSDFNTFSHYHPTATIQSPSAQATGTDSIDMSSLSNSYNPLDAFASLFDQTSQSEIHIGSDMDSSRHSSTQSHSLVYPQPQPGSESRGDSFFSVDSLYDMAFPGDQHDHHQYDQKLKEQQYNTAMDDPWSASLATNHPDEHYAYETIDPTLLGGGAEVESELEIGLALEMDANLDVMGRELEPETVGDQVRQNDNGEDGFDIGLNQSSPSSPSSPSSSQEKKAYFSLQSVSTADDPVPNDDKEIKTEKTYTRKLPPRKRVKRVMPDMLSHHDIDLLSKRRKAKIRLPTPSSSSAPDADRSNSESTSENDDDKSTVRKPIPISKPPGSLKNPIARSISPLIEKKMIASQGDPKSEWPLDVAAAYCHQCRRKTFYAKMTCSDCQKKFCVRCYAFRYPECEFDADDKEYSCPACEGFCNCTVCCRRRGEPYVGVRTCDPDVVRPPPRSQRPRNTKVERVKLGAKTNLPPPTMVVQTTTIPNSVTKVWGSLYSVTGEKIGACFFDPSAEKNSSIVFAPATSPIITTITEVAQQIATEAPTSEPKQVKTKRKLKRHIFIGEAQPSWGYKNPKIKLLKPEPYSKRSYNSMPRFYIGKRACLFYPIEEDDSSLTPLDESDEAPEADGSDAEGKSFSPDSLGDGDVTRAIFLGLTACGVAAAVQVPMI